MFIRQYTQKGDPRIRVKLPEALVVLLKQEAKLHKRPYQDEMVRRLIATFKKNTEYRSCASLALNRLNAMTNFVSYGQMISRDVLSLLQAAAEVDQHTLEQEISCRLQMTFMEACAMGASQIYTKIMCHKITEKDQRQEKGQWIQGQRYVFELQQLELNIRNESWLPKELTFTAFEKIDVSKASKSIREHLKEESVKIVQENLKLGL